MRKQKIQFIVLAVILIVCIGGYFGITSYYKNKESNEKEASTIKVLEIENYRTHFNFLMEKEISCIVQHEYMDTKNDGGRGDYVRSVILQLEEKFNRVGNQRE